MKTLSLKEAAEFLRLSADALRDMAVAGKVPGAQLGPNGGRTWIFTDESLEEYLRQEIARQTATKRGVTQPTERATKSIGRRMKTPPPLF